MSAACLLLATAGPSVSQTPPHGREDLLRFLNGDSLHGEFAGIADGGEIRWRHGSARDPMVLDASKLRRLAFNGGRAPRALQTPSHVLLNDGDRIPGRITSLDGEKLTLETEFAGLATIPRGSIRQIAPNPHGGALHYVGPFARDDWTVLEPEEDQSAEAGKPEKEKSEAPAGEPDTDEPGGEAAWVFGGGAYYSNGQLPIAVDARMPDKTRIRFTLAWRDRLHAVVAFHATLEQPPRPEQPEEPAARDGKKAAGARGLRRDHGSSSGFATTYGHSYVLTISSTYAQLHRCDFSEEGAPDMSRLPSSGSTLRLDEAGEVPFELRCDRENATVALFANGRYVSQWEDGEGYAGTGSHLAFACQNSTSRLRVSDVMVTSWNGLMDSAQSMEVDDRDVVLL
ncbi:MAG: hypothetical protein GWO24_25545, partial [Akkermansiaceae bacterium]|nr:hypothetical protein [Akkermansiaceae bacterium]